MSELEVILNGERRRVNAGLSLQGLVSALDGAPQARGVAVAVDGEVIPRTAWGRTILQEGARVEIVAAVQGG